MKKFETINSTAIPLPIENVDTDQIIPSRFLKSTQKAGFGNYLFADWRFLNDGLPNTDFVLNNPIYSGDILVAGKNFGSGSSREHAAWSILDYGFKVVISSYFGDIFKNNSLNNGLLPVVVSESFLNNLLSDIYQNPHTKITVDLSKQEVINLTSGEKELFEINAYKKECLLNGLDDIDYLLANKPLIEEFELVQH